MKLVEVMACVDRIAKNGNNTAQNYRYAMAADVYDAVRSELAQRFVTMTPSVTKSEFFEAPTKAGGVMRFCTLHVNFTFTDAETGETQSGVIVGQGSDSGDKGVYKAMTGATKAFLVNTFLIPTGDDPENEKAASRAPPPAGAEALKARMKPTPPQSVGAAVQRHTNSAGHDRTISFGFGNNKGVPLSALDDKSLAWYASCLNRDLADASKAKWHDKTRTQLTALLAEQQMREHAAHDTMPDSGADEPPPIGEEYAPPF